MANEGAKDNEINNVVPPSDSGHVGMGKQWCYLQGSYVCNYMVTYYKFNL